MVFVARLLFNQSIWMIMSLEQEIKSHSQRIENGQARCYQTVCTNCSTEGAFRLVDHRPRTFRLVVEGAVKILSSRILRWRCQECKRRFTDYPPFRLAQQTVRQADRFGEVARLFGSRCLLQENGRARGTQSPVCRRRESSGDAWQGSAPHFGTQHSVAMAELVGWTDHHPSQGLGVDPSERSELPTSSRTVGLLVEEVSIRAAAQGACACRSPALGDRNFREIVRKRHLSPVRNRDRSELS